MRPRPSLAGPRGGRPGEFCGGLKPYGGHVPTLLAAYSPAGLDRIARRADGWTPAGIPVSMAMQIWEGVRHAAEGSA